MWGLDRLESADAADEGGERFPLPPAPVEDDSLRRALPRIIAAAMIGALLGVGAKAIMRPTYGASAEILIEPNPAKDLPGDLTPKSVDSNSAINFVESQMGVITSAPVMARALRALNPKAGAADDAAALLAFQRGISVTRADRSLVVDVTAKASTPQDAANDANAVVAAYVAEDSDSRAKAANDLTATLTARIVDRRRALKEAEDKVVAFRAENGLEGAHDPKILDRTLSDASVALNAAATQAAEAEARLKQLDAAPRDLSAIVATGDDPQSKRLTALIEAQRAAHDDAAKLQGTLGDRHPDLVAARQRAALADKRVEAALADVRRTLRAQADVAAAQSSALQARLEGQSAQAGKIGDSTQRLKTLEADVESARTTLQAFETRAQEAIQTAFLPADGVRIVAPARAPPASGGPLGYIAFAVAGALAAMLAAFGLVMARAAYAAGGGADQDEEFSVPRAPLPRGLSAQASANADAMLDQYDRDPDGAFAAAIDRVFAHMGGAGAILVTGRRKGAGRSTIAANLARAAAAAGKRTLLIESEDGGAYAHVARDGLEKGRIDLAGGARIAYRVADSQGDLHVAPHGSDAAADGPHRRFARADFDVVVIDGPLASSPAAADLAAAADCVIAVERKSLVPMPPFVAFARPAASPGRRARVVNFAA